MAVLLSLFSDEEMKGFAASSARVSLPDASCFNVQGVRKDEVCVNPCNRCSLRGLCDPDECGQKLFALDTPFPPTKWCNLGEYINCLKHYGWA